MYVKIRQCKSSFSYYFFYCPLDKTCSKHMPLDCPLPAIAGLLSGKGSRSPYTSSPSRATPPCCTAPDVIRHPLHEVLEGRDAHSVRQTILQLVRSGAVIFVTVKSSPPMAYRSAPHSYFPRLSLVNSLVYSPS